MAESLAARGPFAGLHLPLAIGECSAAEFAPEAVFSVMPFRGRTAEVGAALGMALPGPNATAAAAGRRLLWTGKDAWLVLGPTGLADDLARRLAGRAAVSDQSDSLAGLTLSGADARAVLARLCPLDLDRGAFPDGATARTDLAHIMGQVTRAGDASELMVPRSYAAHFLHEVEAAMRSVAAQRALRP
ncbi:MAG TPA: sarcosine oxidase subunit gamma family protein [Paracoccaceae bacterium]|nr:sarcosine oxidase subunit gamma family protein [Paracoccaceae bacterium]